MLYVRNLAFQEVNLARINPSLPYHDTSRPHVRWWFSASDAEDVEEFNELLRPDRQNGLEREAGFCGVTTQLGKGFVQQRRVRPVAQRRLEALAKRPGWFPTIGDLLDWLRQRRRGGRLPPDEWRRMQWRWAYDLVGRELRQRRRLRRLGQA